MANRDEVKKILSMFVTLPNSPMSDDQKVNATVVDIFYGILGDIEFKWLMAAALSYLGSDNKFFPSNPGTLRDLSFDLEMTAQGVPTASQAWAMVMRGPSMIPARICETSHGIRENLVPGSLNYWHGLSELHNHEMECLICQPTSREGSYGNEVVDEVVRLMGGRDVIFTDNATADRARFLDSYRELVLAEHRRAQYLPMVQALIADPDRPALTTRIRSLAGMLAAGGDRR